MTTQPLAHKALIVGGSNGIGLALTHTLLEQHYHVVIADRTQPDTSDPVAQKAQYIPVNLLTTDYSFLDQLPDIDTLIITAGFGRVSRFETMNPAEIENLFRVNTLSVTHLLHHYYPRMLSSRPFHCAIMGSIAGLMSSPLIATYAASKAAVCNIIESLNIELEMAGSPNRILNVSPGSIAGTHFSGGNNNIDLTLPLAREIIDHMLDRNTLFIPKYDEIYRNVLQQYHDDPHAYGVHSYNYKVQSGRFNDHPQMKIGYLSGTFDLFHIGHLNMLRRAKEICDYLVVGVHKDASHKGKTAFIPLDERKAIVRSVRWVDSVIDSEPEDCDIFLKGIVPYNYLFVGSDYKGTDRFNRYEQLLTPHGVKIIYFPYTQGTSSTQLREALDRNNRQA